MSSTHMVLVAFLARSYLLLVFVVLVCIWQLALVHRATTSSRIGSAALMPDAMKMAPAHNAHGNVGLDMNSVQNYDGFIHVGRNFEIPKRMLLLNPTRQRDGCHAGYVQQVLQDSRVEYMPAASGGLQVVLIALTRLMLQAIWQHMGTRRQGHYLP